MQYQYYVKAVYAAVVAFASSVSGALLVGDDIGFGDISTGAWVVAGVLALTAFGGILGWQAAPPTVSTSVKS